MCPVCAGILVQFQPETVSSFIWNSCPVSTGNLVQFRPEYAIKAKVLALGAPERSAKRNIDEKDLVFLHSQNIILS